MEIIAITGGKGGTGKSTIATTIAFELSHKHQVLLVDADVDCPNDHLILKINRKLRKKVYQRIPIWNFSKCTQCGRCGPVCRSNAIVSIKGKNPIFTPSQCNGCGACVIECPVGAISWGKKEIGTIFEGVKGNLNLLSGELKTNEPVSEFIVNDLIKIIKKQRNNYDYIIIDTAAGLHCHVITALENSNIILSVTEPTPLGAHDLNLILELLKRMGINSSIILNKADIGDKKIITNLALKFNKQIIAEIPYSKNIASQYAEGGAIKDDNIIKIIYEHIK